MKDLSRRDFLKGALAGTASVAAMGILGACSTDASETAASTAASTTAAETTSAAAAPEASKAPDGLYTPGTYSGQAEGIGTVTVTMTFDENNITDVVLDLSDETPSIGQAAHDELKAAIMAAQSSEIDAVSGVTITTTAVSKAAAKCIAQAKGEIPIEVITEKSDDNDGDWLGTEPEIADSDIAEEIGRAHV